VHPLPRHLSLLLCPLLPAMLPLKRYAEKGEHVARTYRSSKACLPVLGFSASRCNVAELVESVFQHGEQIEHHLLVKVDGYAEVSCL